jgi:hypothetical protein
MCPTGPGREPEQVGSFIMAKSIDAYEDQDVPSSVRECRNGAF